MPRRTRLPRARDAGFSLIEVVVSMSVMAVFMAIMTTGIVQVYRVVNSDEAVSIAQSQINIAFLRLDREIRYASDMSTEGQVGADWYVEYLTTYTGTPICTELRLHVANAQLQRRSWTQGGTPPSTWTIFASGVSDSRPFTFSAADATFNYPRLALSLTASSGAGSTAAAKEINVTFTAMNTTSSSASVCTEGRAS
jgi:prepilin-type N-terminal cleavage/methylation domain-containing protein